MLLLLLSAAYNEPLQIAKFVSMRFPYIAPSAYSSFAEVWFAFLQLWGVGYELHHLILLGILGVDLQCKAEGSYYPMSNCFQLICLLHSGITMVFGMSIMFHYNDRNNSVSMEMGARPRMVLGSTPHDQLLIWTSESLVGLCFTISGMMLFMVSFARDAKFHSFFAKGCVAMYMIMAAWRLWFQRKVADYALEWPQQVIGDVLLALSWIFYLAWNWRDKYD
ncbi:hypothetical protein GOP47_0002008 [Adiantum capillus-veneris]|uniref:DUF7865 domain-containing protein n=1 Tax=Adiantum capillus-veneris TaxID=13818 RepID=A0A9D4VA43_ADICA|nr:hypothetical protein GOP47_0002008 [Adiantum capillus-veneris]